jgi:hypothetical protein
MLVIKIKGISGYLQRIEGTNEYIPFTKLDEIRHIDGKMNFVYP